MFRANRYYLLDNPWSNELSYPMLPMIQVLRFSQAMLSRVMLTVIATTNHFNLFYRSYLFQIIRFKKGSFLGVNRGKELFFKLLVWNHTKSKPHSLFQKYTSDCKIHIQKTPFIKVYLYYKKNYIWVWKLKSFLRVT